MRLRKVRLWYQSQVIWDDELVNDLMEFFGLSRNELLGPRACRHKSLCAIVLLRGLLL